MLWHILSFLCFLIFPHLFCTCLKRSITICFSQLSHNCSAGNVLLVYNFSIKRLFTYCVSLNKNVQNQEEKQKRIERKRCHGQNSGSLNEFWNESEKVPFISLFYLVLLLNIHIFQLFSPVFSIDRTQLEIRKIVDFVGNRSVHKGYLNLCSRFDILTDARWHFKFYENIFIICLCVSVFSENKLRYSIFSFQGLFLTVLTNTKSNVFKTIETINTITKRNSRRKLFPFCLCICPVNSTFRNFNWLNHKNTKNEIRIKHKTLNYLNEKFCAFYPRPTECLHILTNEKQNWNHKFLAFFSSSSSFSNYYFRLT